MTHIDATGPQRAETGGSGQATKRRRWLPLIVTASVLVVLAVGGFIAVHFLNEGRTAQATAQEYFDALAAGDAETANALTADLSSDDAAFLTDDVLAAATERISDVEVVPADDPLDVFDQNVIVTYTLDGRQVEDRVVLSRGEPEWGVLRTWRMSRPYAESATFSVSGPGTLTLAGLPLNDGTPAVHAVLYPGVYPIEVKETTWVESPIDEIVVITGDELENVTMEPTEALTDEVQRQLDDSFRECVAGLESAWDNTGTECPLTAYLSGLGDPRGSWEIIDYPVAAPEPISSGSVYAYSGGEAIFTPDDGSEPATSQGTFAIGWYVTVSDDAVTVSATPPE